MDSQDVFVASPVPPSGGSLPDSLVRELLEQKELSSANTLMKELKVDSCEQRTMVPMFLSSPQPYCTLGPIPKPIQIVFISYCVFP